FVCQMMAAGRFFLSPHCTHLRGALRDAVWDPRHPTQDVRLDDGSRNIDSLDALEYACEPVMDAMVALGAASAVQPPADRALKGLNT
ncbi:MAG: hypothetical protein ACI4ML_13405, partial [Aristaeellaceae bacterium]